MINRTFTWGEAIILPFQVVDDDGNGVDMSADSASLTAFVLRPEAVAAESYLSSTNVTWETQTSGIGYWLWEQSDAIDVTKWGIGVNRIDIWHDNGSDQPRHLGSAEIKIRVSPTGTYMTDA